MRHCQRPQSYRLKRNSIFEYTDAQFVSMNIGSICDKLDNTDKSHAVKHRLQRDAGKRPLAMILHKCNTSVYDTVGHKYMYVYNTYFQI